ncbi:MAG: pyridoxamine 5'-phosphate oxidase family protein [Oscillospiraceae bacterium]|nr:pyridoxamine 5'-phosphate oxidase family protein [Oscillospiraceae bacterium]
MNATMLNFDELAKEIIRVLEETKTIVFATSQDNKVTARTINPVNIGLDIYFGTGNPSPKYQQICANPYVALATGSIQIEAIAAAEATSVNYPSENPEYSKKYDIKFPHQAGGLYPPAKDGVIIKCVPTKITLFKFTDKSYWDTLDIKEKRAYRE